LRYGGSRQPALSPESAIHLAGEVALAGRYVELLTLPGGRAGAAGDLKLSM